VQGIALATVNSSECLTLIDFGPSSTEASMRYDYQVLKELGFWGAVAVG
jgi:hypothetical protein